MEPSPSWEANRFSASQEIPHIFWNMKVHYRIHNCPPPVPVIIIIIIIIIIYLIPLLRMYRLTNLCLSHTVGEINFSQGKEIRPIPQGQEVCRVSLNIILCGTFVIVLPHS
jgi:hypothetical protein